MQLKTNCRFEVLIRFYVKTIDDKSRFPNSILLIQTDSWNIKMVNFRI